MNFKKNHTCVSCDKKCAIFQLLNEEELTLLENRRFEVKHKAGEIIAKQGTLSSYIISLNKGMAKVYIEGDNKNLILSLVKPTELIGGPGIFVDTRMHYSVAALKDSTVCLIEVDAFKKVIRQNGYFAEAYIENFSRRSIHTFNHFAHITQKHMHGRLAECLIYLSEAVFKADAFDMVINRQELGDYTAMTKESVCRILKDFKDDAIIKLKGNYIELLNKDQLRQISANG